MRGKKIAVALWAMVMLLAAFAASAGARTIYVATTGSDVTGDGSAGDPYATIQKGVDQAADSGDTVQVAAGAYYATAGSPTFWVSKNLDLVGAGAGKTFIGGSLVGCLAAINASGILSGFTLEQGLAPNGAGIYLENSAVNVIDCEIVNNVSTGDGAGVFITGSTVMISECVLAGNEAGTSGGGVAVEGGSVVQMIGNDIIMNRGSTSGGGVFISNSTATLIGNYIVANNSDLWGGGLSLYRANVTMIGEKISLNFTYYHGGGVYARENNALSIDSTRIEQNATYDRGGGLYLWSSPATVTNTVIAGNLSPIGGGMYLRSSTGVTLTNNTVADNRFDGMVVDSAGSAAITNCILWGNGGGGGDLVGATASYSDIGTGATAGSGNISIDPQFVGSGDYHLQVGSPCINQGDNAATNLPASDIDRNPRILGGTVDMGADEVNPWQPDLWIKQGRTWLGDNVYNDDGAGQTGRQAVVAGTSALYRVRLYNDGEQTETFWIQGSAGNANWSVRYFWGSVVKDDREVTDEVTSATGLKRLAVVPQGVRYLLVQVTPNSGLAIGSKLAILVTAHSDRSPIQRDTVKTITLVK